MIDANHLGYARRWTSAIFSQLEGYRTLATKRRPAMEVAQWHSSSSLWLDHANISVDDVSRFEAVEKLTLWNVTYPADLFVGMPKLWWLDIRGGTAKNVHSLSTAQNLRYLRLNQIRGFEDVHDIPFLTKLELLSLYGLSKVTKLPSLSGLSYLRRVQIGQMKKLQDLVPVWNAHQLTEIELLKDVPVRPEDIDTINSMPNLEAFLWGALDVPSWRCAPIHEGVTFPHTRPLHAAEWFEQRDMSR